MGKYSIIHEERNCRPDPISSSSVVIPAEHKWKVMEMEKKPSPYSWWWDSHKSPQHSQWLQATIRDLDQRTKAMLTLIQEDGDSFAQKAEMYYQRRPELVKMVEDFYRSYRSLAERYDQLRSDSAPPSQQSCSSSSSNSCKDHQDKNSSSKRTERQNLKMQVLCSNPELRVEDQHPCSPNTDLLDKTMSPLASHASAGITVYHSLKNSDLNAHVSSGNSTVTVSEKPETSKRIPTYSETAACLSLRSMSLDHHVGLTNPRATLHEQRNTCKKIQTPTETTTHQNPRCTSLDHCIGFKNSTAALCENPEARKKKQTPIKNAFYSRVRSSSLDHPVSTENLTATAAKIQETNMESNALQLSNRDEGTEAVEFPQGTRCNNFKVHISRLIEDNHKQQSELIKRNDEKREAIKELYAHLGRLSDENRVLQSCLRRSKLPTKRGQSVSTRWRSVSNWKFW